MLGFVSVSGGPVASVATPPRVPVVVRPPAFGSGGLLGFGPISAAPLATVPTFQPPEVVEPPIVITLPGGGPYAPLWLELIAGYGYGVLPELVGEAYGTVIAAGNGAAMLRNPAGEAAGAVGVGGWGDGPLRLKAAACGACGVQCRAVGAIAIKGSAIGRQDDDDEAIAWLLAA